MATQFTPDTEVRLIAGVPLDDSYNDTYDFDSLTAQESFFNNFRVQTFTDFTYQRERHSIIVPMIYDRAVEYNYVMYRNRQFSTKWFYAFVMEVNYLNPNATEIVIKMDVMQTWLFDYEVKPSFIEREHVYDDTLFKHTLAEGLEFGPIEYQEIGAYDLSQMAIVLAYMPSEIDKSPGSIIDGVYTGVKYVWFGTSENEIAALNSVLDSFSSAGLIDSVVSLFMIPAQFILNMEAGARIISPIDGFGHGGGYKARNNKLYCWPYYYVTVDNGNGASVNYRYELFRNPLDFRLNLSSIYNMEASCVMFPLDYNNIQYNWNEGLSLSGFPQCSWRSDIYANWLARNRYGLGFQTLTQGLNLVSGAAGAIATGNISGVVSPALQVLGTMAQIGDKAMFPYQLQGQPSADTLNIKWQRVGYHIFGCRLKREYAEIIDDYFDKYGYKVNYLGVPNTKSRPSWNYVKTIECTIVGKKLASISYGIPTDHLNTIKNCYNKGITFWHGNYLGDYTRSNRAPGTITPSYPDPTPLPTPPERPVAPGGEWTYPIDKWEQHVTSEYGWRTNPITGEQQFHRGMDIACPEGTEIRAIHSGRCHLVGVSNARGNYVDITVDSQTIYRYQHCSQILVKKMDNVTAGQIIAKVGTTGQVTGAHLHVEIIVEGNTVNPRNYLGNSPLG